MSVEKIDKVDLSRQLYWLGINLEETVIGYDSRGDEPLPDWVLEEIRVEVERKPLAAKFIAEIYNNMIGKQK